jgi:antitoxin ParD1/3/4
MNIALKLTLTQEAWIEAAVARGDFASPEEALASIIDTGICALETEPDDDMNDDEVAFVRAKIAEAEDDVANGRTKSWDEVSAKISAMIAAHRPK